MKIEYIERMLVAVRDLEASRENWRRAGFGVAPGTFEGGRLSIARLAAGAIEIDLCAAADSNSRGPLNDHLREAAERGGGIIGWIWGASDRGESASIRGNAIALPGWSEATVDAELLASSLPGVITGATGARLGLESRAQRLRAICGANQNTVEYLEHLVVMTPVLEDAIAANEAVGVPCKRIREAGHGVRQAFFKLEQTVIEVVAPTRNRPGCWGVALMCADIARAVAVARDNGLEATSPKQAIQGGQIARIVAPLDGVAIAYMQAGPRIDD
ncbi:MAG: hypothetical protein Q7S58_19020 [Candidatus Binatus sp.]|uniref:hypothetical protein n=1 Tax=Candidatus Binatus sp. TaxID=2811406 RepID=UPI0027220EA6|nr:hypothetical protein [Candidatus Binatus sp.]MDO8434493.1 hypothetical protein [Candidatus Binatus sp.]